MHSGMQQYQPNQLRDQAQQSFSQLRGPTAMQQVAARAGTTSAKHIPKSQAMIECLNSIEQLVQEALGKSGNAFELSSQSRIKEFISELEKDANTLNLEAIQKREQHVKGK